MEMSDETGTNQTRLLRSATSEAGNVTPELYAPVSSSTFSCDSNRSASDTATCGFVWLSAKTSLSLAPPRERIPPLELISSRAISWARLLWAPCGALSPLNGRMDPILISDAAPHAMPVRPRKRRGMAIARSHIVSD